MTGEDLSNAAALVHLVTFGLALVFVAVAVWRRFRTPRRPALRYLVGAICLVALSTAALLYAAWPA
jgi:CHASE2 domain-containing sensor protein